LGTGPNNTSNPTAVKNHPFFDGLDWDRLYRREYAPPFVPTVAHLYDLRNIDPQFVNEPIPQSILNDGNLTATISADAVSVDMKSGARMGQTFQGFTFIGEDSWMMADESNHGLLD
jgi:serum/glucocorticoid-regulated kinase 1